MPLQNQSLLDVVQEHLHDIPYDEKVKMYDDRCNGCGFARIWVHNASSNFRDFYTSRVEEAIHVARMGDCFIERTCVYPPDMEVCFGKEMPIQLTTIVRNTCAFWDVKKVDCYSREQTEFIEVETVEELNVRTESVSAL